MSSRALRRRSAFFTIPVAAAAIAATGCAGGRGSPATTVAVTATDTACAVEPTSVPAGAVRFAVHNRGSITTEVYLLGDDDRVVDEVENIDPGDSAEFRAEPGGGRYTVNCKPGQVGDGVRAALEVTGEPSADQLAEPDPATARGVPAFRMPVVIDDAGFAGQFVELAVVSGQVVTFDVTNGGTVPHGFAVLAPDGVTALAQSDAIEPGATATLAVAFAQTGPHTAVDPLEDHRSRGVEATFRVVE